MTNNEILEELQKLNVDVEISLERFLGNADMYIGFIKEFPSDKSIYTIENYLDEEKWEHAFEIAHTLKGVTGNLGMTTMFEDFSKMCVAYRKNDYTEMKTIYNKIKNDYTDMCKHIGQF